MSKPDMHIVDPDPEVERILSEMDAKVNRPILGPDGRELLKPVVDDRTITYSKDGESYSVDPEELIMRAGRMLRDGMSLANIRAELDLVGVSDRILESACRLGIQWLDAGIMAGTQPAESVTVLGYVPVTEDEPEHQNPQDVEHALEVGRGIAAGWNRRGS